MDLLVLALSGSTGHGSQHVCTGHDAEGPAVLPHDNEAMNVGLNHHLRHLPHRRLWKDQHRVGCHVTAHGVCGQSVPLFLYDGPVTTDTTGKRRRPLGVPVVSPETTVAVGQRKYTDAPPLLIHHRRPADPDAC